MLDHPYHLHGFFFQVLEINGLETTYRAWKETVNVPRNGSVKIAWIADNRPGSWMYHCHILEHHAAGMMAHFEGINGNQKAHHHIHHHAA
jgi:FtsP/CotA-like multicopper oxidase with cupredoxin domain